MEPFLMFFNAAWQGALGKVSVSREQWKQTRQKYISLGAKEFAAGLMALEAYDDALLGYRDEARQKASQAIELSPDPDTRSEAAFALATAGDVQKSSTLIAGLERDAPDNHFIQSEIIPQVRAAQQIEKNQLADALSTLESLRPYEFGVGAHAVGVTPVFMRGIVYLKMHDGAKAAAEFQRILDHRGAAGFAIEYPLSRLNVGRAYALQGDTAKARTAYQDFFAAWKDADPDVPVLKAAKAEYEKLK
jgi:tetratricopeptide (TPR) repeat protein